MAGQRLPRRQAARRSARPRDAAQREGLLGRAPGDVRGQLARRLAVQERASRLTVSYTYFRQQAEAGNIKEVSSKGDTIEGEVRRDVRYPPDDKGKVTHLFKTTRPAFADDKLLELLTSKGTEVNARSVDEGRSLLRNLINEAALSAARQGIDAVQRRDFGDALEKIVLGTARQILLSPEDRRRTAYHESGHALIGMLEPGADPVRKVSIIPRGRALGATFQSPDQDRYGYSESYLLGRIMGAVGGRAAEELVYGEVTTGAESDLEQSTRLARQMVGRWGMSQKIGLVSVLPGPEDQPLFFPGVPGGASERTRETMDDEVKRITDECYTKALATLRDHRAQLDTLASALLDRETLDEVDAYQAAGIPLRARPVTNESVPQLTE